MGGDGGCRVGEVRASTTSSMPDHKGFKLQLTSKFSEIQHFKGQFNDQRFLLFCILFEHFSGSMHVCIWTLVSMFMQCMYGKVV